MARAVKQPDKRGRYFNSPDMRNISVTAGGYWVRFYRQTSDGKGRLTEASFAASKLGSWQAALEAAKAWRDETEKKLRPGNGKKIHSAPVGHSYITDLDFQTRNRKTGAVNAEKTRVYFAWIRLEEGKNLFTRRSTRKLGFQGAYEEAYLWLVKQREMLEKRLRAKGITTPLPPIEER